MLASAVDLLIGVPVELHRGIVGLEAAGQSLGDA